MGRESLGRGAVHIQAGVQRLAPRGDTGLGPGPADALPSQLLGLPSALAGSAAPDFPVLRSKPCPGPWGSSRVGRVTFSLLTLVQVSCLHGHDWSLLPPPPVRGCKPCSCPGDVLVCLPPLCQSLRAAVACILFSTLWPWGSTWRLTGWLSSPTRARHWTEGGGTTSVLVVLRPPGVPPMGAAWHQTR